MYKLRNRDGKQPHIGLDLGDTVFNRRLPRIQIEKADAMQLCDGAMLVLISLLQKGCKLSVISKIDKGNEARVSYSLFHSGLVPNLIDPRDVAFCYTRKGKGPIAREKRISIHIDDRIEVLNSMHKSGVEHKILFTGIRDDRDEKDCHKFVYNEVHIASTWIEIQEIIEGFCIEEL